MEINTPNTAKRKISFDFIRNFVFGVEDSLVSTIGLVSGIAAAGVSRSTLILTGIILIFVEAFSMAAGSLLSENSVEEFNAQKVIPLGRSFSGAIIMFFSYFLSGFVILGPYLIFEKSFAFVASVVISLVFLFILGMYTGKLSGISGTKRGATVALVGGAAILIGVSIGYVLEKFFL